MDKNQIIGFLLMGVVLIGFFYFTKPNEDEQQSQKNTVDTVNVDQQKDPGKNTDTTIIDTANIEKDTSTNNIVVSDSTADTVLVENLKKNFGIFADAAKGDEKIFTLKNDKIILKITNKGARVYSAQLTEYSMHNGKPLVLFEGDSNRFNINFIANDKVIKTEDLYFQNDNSDSIINASNNEKSFSLKAKVDDNRYVEYVYRLKPGKYMVDFEINFVNLQDVMPLSTTYLELYWQEYAKHLERGEKWERQNTKIFYKLLQDDVEEVKGRKDLLEEEVSSKVRWISFKQQFFNTTLLAKNSFNYSKLTSEALPDDTTNMYLMKSKLTVPFQVTEKTTIDLAYYFGPNKYSILRKIKIKDQRMKLEKLIPLGGKFLGLINKGVIIPLFNFLGKYINNYGIIILVLTVIIKLVLFPLTYKSYTSAAKMRILKPEIDKATKKIPKDKQMEKQQATMSIYKKAGVSPMGGCLPTLLQLPILIALYRFFPASIELRQKAFLWVNDLSTYDAIVTWEANIPIVNWIFGNHISLFTLLMAAAMVINTMLTSANSSMDSSNPQAKTMKIMMYFLPVMMIIWFNGYSAGLSYYYFLSTLIGIVQVILIRRFLDEDKVLAQLRKNMKNNKTPKKSKFQKRLEEMQKQQEAYKRKRKK